MSCREEKSLQLTSINRWRGVRTPAQRKQSAGCDETAVTCSQHIAVTAVSSEVMLASPILVCRLLYRLPEGSRSKTLCPGCEGSVKTTVEGSMLTGPVNQIPDWHLIVSTWGTRNSKQRVGSRISYLAMSKKRWQVFMGAIHILNSAAQTTNVFFSQMW